MNKITWHGKFLLIIPAKQRIIEMADEKSKIVKNVNPKDRVNPYPKGTFHTNGEVVFCTTCNHTVTFIRKSSLDQRALESECTMDIFYQS